eukprot:PhM_4_TR1284/c1_g1_i1/m.7162
MRRRVSLFDFHSLDSSSAPSAGTLSKQSMTSRLRRTASASVLTSLRSVAVAVAMTDVLRRAEALEWSSCAAFASTDDDATILLKPTLTASEMTLASLLRATLSAVAPSMAILMLSNKNVCSVASSVFVIVDRTLEMARVTMRASPRRTIERTDSTSSMRLSWFDTRARRWKTLARFGSVDIVVITSLSVSRTERSASSRTDANCVFVRAVRMKRPWHKDWQNAFSFVTRLRISKAVRHAPNASRALHTTVRPSLASMKSTRSTAKRFTRSLIASNSDTTASAWLEAKRLASGSTDHRRTRRGATAPRWRGSRIRRSRLGNTVEKAVVSLRDALSSSSSESMASWSEASIFFTITCRMESYRCVCLFSRDSTAHAANDVELTVSRTTLSRPCASGSSTCSYAAVKAKDINAVSEVRTVSLGDEVRHMTSFVKKSSKAKWA